MKYTVRIGERQFTVEIADPHARPIRATVEGDTFEIWPEPSTDVAHVVTTTTAQPGLPPSPLKQPQVAAAAPPASPTASSNSHSVLAPIPGVIVSVAVQAGASVQAGQELCVLEAMKMRSPIRSPRAGVIAAVRVAVGQQVKHRDVLVEYAD